jgi:molybdopterin-guanine dinucleotide biosynthesis adapter protein
VRRLGNVEPPIYPHDPNVIALATDHPVESPLPVLDLNDADKIAQFIIDRLALRP